MGDPWELVYGHNSVSAGYGTGSSAAAGGWRDGASAAAASGEGTAESLGQQGAAAERLLAYGSSEVTEALVASSMGEGRPPARPGGGAPTGKTSRFNLDAYRWVVRVVCFFRGGCEWSVVDVVRGWLVALNDGQT